MEKEQIFIGVSKLAPNYELWLKRLDGNIEIIDFYRLPADEFDEKVSSFSGIVLSGGYDLHSGLYGRPDDLRYCKEVDVRRDQLETTLIECAFRYRIPLLGICRGQQILNVVMKGTLFADIPAYVKSEIKHKDQEDVFHAVTLAKDSLLCRVTGVSEGTVNSAHHQAVKKVAPGLKVVAMSEDGIIEAIEADSSLDHPFCLAVQWHPERMDLLNPLSGKLGQAFIKCARMKLSSEFHHYS
jgi:putative glutamine amidotransferase